MKYLIAFIFIFCTQFFSFCQDKDDNSIQSQFDKILRISTTYQTYKVIDKNKFITLKENVLDSLKVKKREITQKEIDLNQEKENVKKLISDLTIRSNELNESLKKEKSISLLGFNISKTTYNSIMWSLILLLSIGLGFFVFKFSRSNILTKKAEQNLNEVEQEFEKHRKNSLKREQKLRRQLQDEINKQRNS